MNTIPTTDPKTPIDSTDVLQQPVNDRPLSSKAIEKRGNSAAWLWAALFVVLAAVVGSWLYSAARGDGDRGIRGPADQAAPDAPRGEKQRPSTGR